MRQRKVTLAELGLVAGTRAIGGVGLGLLLAGRLTDRERRAIGWTLFLMGALSTIPLALQILGKDDGLAGDDLRTRRDRTRPLPAEA